MSAGCRTSLIGRLAALLLLAPAPAAFGYDICVETIHPFYLATNPSSLIQISTDQEADALRAALIDHIWPGVGFPTDVPDSVTPDVAAPPGVDALGLTNLSRIDELDMQLGWFGFTSIAHHFLPTVANGRLVVLHQGHLNSVVDNGVGEMLKLLLGDGFSVITFEMPGFGQNVAPYAPHDEYVQLVPFGNPLKAFVQPVAEAINYAVDVLGYSDVSMVGLSGGGWTTTLYAALDPRVATSVPVAGSLPLYLHGGPCPFNSDWEQKTASIYQEVASYLDLYILGAYGEGRKHTQILSKYDGCCFRGIVYQTYEPTVRQLVTKSLSKGRWDFYLDTTHGGEHGINANSQMAVLRGLGRPLYVVDSLYDSDVVRIGSWSPIAGTGYDGTYHRTNVTAGFDTLIFEFHDIQAGTYRVAATWPSDESFATDAKFTVTVDDNPLPAVSVDMQSDPQGFDFQGATWQELAVVDTTTGKIEVDLNSLANGWVAADAIYVERIGDIPYPGPQDPDLDGIQSDGDGSGVAGDLPCNGRDPEFCDDNCPNISNPDQLDLDSDGHGDVCDNCLETGNVFQIDTNQDGFGNFCDADYDQSGWVGGEDFAIFRAAFATFASDPGYDPDVDVESDGVIGGGDFFRFRANFFRQPGPSGLACAGTIPCP